MASLAIRFSVMLLLCTYSLSAQQRNTVEYITKHLFALKADDTITADKTAYILVTNRSCYSCYKEVCEFLKNESYANHELVALVLCKKNLPACIRYNSELKKTIPCAQKILFHFTDWDTSQALQKIIQSPSPMLLIKKGERYHFYPYKKTIHLLKRNDSEN